MLERLDTHTRAQAESVGVLPSIVANTFELYAMRHSNTLDCLGLRIAPNTPSCVDLMMLCIPLEWLDQVDSNDWTGRPWNGTMAVGTGLLCTGEELGQVIRLLGQWRNELAPSPSSHQHMIAGLSYFEGIHPQDIESSLQPYMREARSADTLYRCRVESCRQSFNVAVAFLALRRNLTISMARNLGSLDLAAYTQAQLSDPLFDPYYGNGVGIITVTITGLGELIDILSEAKREENWGR